MHGVCTRSAARRRFLCWDSWKSLWKSASSWNRPHSFILFHLCTEMTRCHFEIFACDSSFMTDNPITVFSLNKCHPWRRWHPWRMSYVLFITLRVINRKILMDGAFLTSNGCKINTLILWCKAEYCSPNSLSKEKLLLLWSKNFLNNDIWRRCGKDLALFFASVSLLIKGKKT